MNIDHFLETNYIDPIILKYTRFNPTRKLDDRLKCSGTCGGWYDIEVMKVITYDTGKRRYRCPECMEKYKPRYGTR